MRVSTYVITLVRLVNGLINSEISNQMFWVFCYRLSNWNIKPTILIENVITSESRHLGIILKVRIYEIS